MPLIELFTVSLKNFHSSFPENASSGMIELLSNKSRLIRRLKLSFAQLRAFEIFGKQKLSEILKNFVLRGSSTDNAHGEHYRCARRYINFLEMRNNIQKTATISCAFVKLRIKNGLNMVKSEHSTYLQMVVLYVEC